MKTTDTSKQTYLIHQEMKNHVKFSNDLKIGQGGNTLLVLAYLIKNSYLTKNKETFANCRKVADTLQMSSDTVYRALSLLKKENYIEYTATTRGILYRVVNRCEIVKGETFISFFHLFLKDGIPHVSARDRYSMIKLLRHLAIKKESLLNDTETMLAIFGRGDKKGLIKLIDLALSLGIIYSKSVNETNQQNKQTENGEQNEK